MEWKRQQDPLQMSCHTPQVNPILPLWYTNQLHQLQHWGNCHFFSDPFHHLSFVHYSAKLVNLNSVCGLHPMAISIQYTHENPWRGKSSPLVEFIIQSQSLQRRKPDAICSTSDPVFLPSLRGLLTLNPPHQHSVQQANSDITCWGGDSVPHSSNRALSPLCF